MHREVVDFSGYQIYKLDDGSLFVTGKNGMVDYILNGHVPFENLTGIRIEAIPISVFLQADLSSRFWNFVLSELKLPLGLLKITQWDRTKEWRLDDPLAEEIGWSGSNGAQLKLVGEGLRRRKCAQGGHPTRRLVPRWSFSGNAFEQKAGPEGEKSLNLISPTRLAT